MKHHNQGIPKLIRILRTRSIGNPPWNPRNLPQDIDTSGRSVSIAPGCQEQRWKSNKNSAIGILHWHSFGTFDPSHGTNSQIPFSRLSGLCHEPLCCETTMHMWIAVPRWKHPASCLRFANPFKLCTLGTTSAMDKTLEVAWSHYVFVYGLSHYVFVYGIGQTCKCCWHMRCEDRLWDCETMPTHSPTTKATMNTPLSCFFVNFT